MLPLSILNIIATPYLYFINPDQDELVHIYSTIPRVLATGFDSLSDLLHEKTGSLFGHSITSCCVPCRKALGTGRHLKADEKGLA